MKSLTRPLALATSLLALAGCGGGGENLYLGGSVYGLNTSGLVLVNKNNGVTQTVNAGSTTFVFDKLIGSDEGFDVQVQTNPTGATCEVTYGKGKTAGYSVTNIIVTCKAITHALKGTITGLTQPQLVLINGSDKVTVDGPATSFTLSPVGETYPYAVLVLAQPGSQTCAVVNGVGTMGTSDVTNVQVNCQ